jgi:hypothetical protein
MPSGKPRKPRKKAAKRHWATDASKDTSKNTSTPENVQMTKDYKGMTRAEQVEAADRRRAE